MPQNKNQHYIPQFYLRKFSSDGRSISVLNLKKPEDIILNASIKGQCSKNYLYGKNENLERIIQTFEHEGVSTIKHIEDMSKINNNIRIKILKYISFQHSRTPKSAEMLRDFNEAMLNEMKKLPALFGRQDLIKSIGIRHEDFSDILWENILIGTKTYYALLDLDFVILSNCTEVEFVTSDVALWLHNIWTQDHENALSSLGYASKGLILYFPLNPNLSIFFYDSEIYNISRRRIKNSVLKLTLESDVRNLNKLFFEAAQNAIYFRGNKKTRASLLRDFRPQNIKKPLRSFSLEGPGGIGNVVVADYWGNELKIDLNFLELTHYSKLIPPKERCKKFREESKLIIDKI